VTIVAQTTNQKKCTLLRWFGQTRQIFSAFRFAASSKETTRKIYYIGKCDKVFDELLKKIVKINHIIPSADELKRRACCKWHNSFSHATNDCNVFRRQIQSAINEGQLKF
jgi:hypothetical protein